MKKATKRRLERLLERAGHEAAKRKYRKAELALARLILGGLGLEELVKLLDLLPH